MKAKQGRLAEAEADARRALLSRLADQGRYDPSTPRFIRGLANILVEQGRYEEAEQLNRMAIEITRRLGFATDSEFTVELLADLAEILNYRSMPQEAIADYAELEQAIATWDPPRRRRFDLNASRINSLYASGQIEPGIAAAEALLTHNIALVGERHFGTATARGTLAVGYARAGRNADAIREFRTALPVLISGARENTDLDETSVVAAKSGRLQNIAETYMRLLTRAHAMPADQLALETFQLADAIRGQSVQQALSASSARSGRMTRNLPNSFAPSRTLQNRSTRDSECSIMCSPSLLPNVTRTVLEPLARPSKGRGSSPIQRAARSLGGFRNMLI
jgi:tetratricopeptide (TPR) repeat protein